MPNCAAILQALWRWRLSDLTKLRVCYKATMVSDTRGGSCLLTDKRIRTIDSVTLIALRMSDAATSLALSTPELHAGRVDPRVGSGRVQFDE